MQADKRDEGVALDQKSTARIIWLIDDKLPKEATVALTRSLNYLKSKFSITPLKASDYKEDAVLFRLKAEPADLILVPLKEYLLWERVENALGSNRTKGPIFAGYFCENTDIKILDTQKSNHRRVVLDFKHLLPAEILIILRSMLTETSRSGIRPFLKPETPIYCENWYPDQGLGTRLDNILKLPELSKAHWQSRASSLRILLSGLWGLIYEDGPGKSHEGQGVGSSPIAYFQIAADEQCIAMRLMYEAGSKGSAQETLKLFTPGSVNGTRGRQLSGHYSDFMRVHNVVELGIVEVSLFLFPSASVEKDADHLHSHWIDPINDQLITERPYIGPSPLEPRLRALPSVEVNMPRLKAMETLSNFRTEKTTKRLLTEATQQINALKAKIKEQGDKITELRSGGIGVASPPSMPEPEDLLEAFQERYFDARFQIRQFELQIEKLEKEGGKAYDVEVLKFKMEALANREKAWIRKLMTTLETYRNAIKASSEAKGSKPPKSGSDPST